MGGCASTASLKIPSPPSAVARVEDDRAKDVCERVSAAVRDMPTALAALVVGYCDFSYLGRLRDFETMLNDADMDGFACAVATAYRPVYVIHVPSIYEQEATLSAVATDHSDATLKRYVGVESTALDLFRRPGDGALAPTVSNATKARHFVAAVRELLRDFPDARLYTAPGRFGDRPGGGVVDRSVREYWIERVARVAPDLSVAVPTAHNHPFPFGAADADADRKQSSSSSHDVPAILTFEFGKMGYGLDRSIPTPRVGGRSLAVLEHRPLHWVYGDEFKRTRYSVCGCLFRVRCVALP